MLSTPANQVRRVTIDGELADVVRFGGSTTHATAVRSWLAGRGYVEPALTTRDRTDLHVLLDDDTLLTARPGDYVVRDLSGNVRVLAPAAFRDASALIAAA